MRAALALCPRRSVRAPAARAHLGALRLCPPSRVSPPRIAAARRRAGPPGSLTLERRAHALGAPVLAAAVLLGLSGCEETELRPAARDAGPERCRSDADCPERAACNASTGVCYPLDACGPDRPCRDGQVCEVGEDGFRVCVFERCASDAECAAELDCDDALVPSCQAGACVCGVPCSGGCPAGEGCCIPSDTCSPLPAPCMALTCPLGQQVSITSTGAWSRRSCALEGEVCACEPLPPLREGDIGLYASMVRARSGRTSVAAYNRTWGDLMIGQVAPDRSVAWTFVDGVPTSTATIRGALDGPRGGQGAEGRDVGWFASATLAGDGETVLVAYHDRDAGSLRFAAGPTFDHHQVDAEGEAGLFAHAGLGRGDRPFVVYLARAAGAPGQRRSSLRVALAETLRPASASDWTIRELVDTPLERAPCAERCRRGEVCVLPGERCAVPDAPERCAPACGSDAACVRGRCRPVRDLPLVREPPRVEGLWPAAALAPDGTLHVAYYDATAGGLVLLRVRDGGAGPARALRVAGGRSGRVRPGDDAGRFVDLAVDASGVTHLAFLNRTRLAVRYVQVDPAGAIAVAETVESGLRGGARRLLGADVELLLGPEGPRVAYQDGTDASVRVAARGAGGAWTARRVAGEPGQAGQGFYVDLVPAPAGGVFGVSYRFDLREREDANGVAFFEGP